MSEKYVSHAELDKAVYQMDISDEGLARQRADRAAYERMQQDENARAHEKMKEKEYASELGDAALRNYLRKQQGLGPYDPTEAFNEKLADSARRQRELEDAGKTQTLNGAFTHELDKAKDNSGTIDISKLNPNDLVRYKASLGVLIGENGNDYDKRMQKVFGTSDYMDTLVKLVDEDESWRLREIAKRNPGVNPLADKMLERWNNEEVRDSA